MVVEKELLGVGGDGVRIGLYVEDVVGYEGDGYFIDGDGLLLVDETRIGMLQS